MKIVLAVTVGVTLAALAPSPPAPDAAFYLLFQLVGSLGRLMMVVVAIVFGGFVLFAAAGGILFSLHEWLTRPTR